MEEKMLQVVPPSPIVVPAVSAEIAVERWQEYQNLEHAILAESDYIYYVTWKNERGYPEQLACETKAQADAEARKKRGKVVPRKKKVAFRKLAVFFGLTLPKELAEEEPKIEIQTLGDKFVKIERRKGSVGTIYMDSGFRVIRAEWTVTVQQVREDGKVFTQQGYGECSNNEKMTLKAHNVIATAWTRSLNRAISDLVGFGEVSAEEVSGPQDLDEHVIEGKATVVKEAPADEKKETPKAEKKEEPTNGTKERAKALFELAKGVGYPVDNDAARAKTITGLVHLINSEKTKFSELDEKEAGLLSHYLAEQKMATDDAGKKRIKALGKVVIERCKATGESWSVAYQNTAFVKKEELEKKEAANSEVPELAKVLA